MTVLNQLLHSINQEMDLFNKNMRKNSPDFSHTKGTIEHIGALIKGMKQKKGDMSELNIHKIEEIIQTAAKKKPRKRFSDN